MTSATTPAHVAKPCTLGWWCAGTILKADDDGKEHPCATFNGESLGQRATCRRCGGPRAASQRFLLERASEDREERLGFASRRAVGVLQRAHALAVEAGDAMQFLDRALELGAASLLPDDGGPHVTYGVDVELARQAFRILLDREWSCTGVTGFPCCPECRTEQYCDDTHDATCAWGALCDLVRAHGLAKDDDARALPVPLVGADASVLVHVSTTRDNADCCVMCGVPGAAWRTTPDCPSGFEHADRSGRVCSVHACLRCLEDTP